MTDYGDRTPPAHNPQCERPRRFFRWWLRIAAARAFMVRMGRVIVAIVTLDRPYARPAKEVNNICWRRRSPEI